MAVNPGNGGAQPGSDERDPRLDLLYRAAPREMPPSHLDAAILAAARREVGARPLATPLRRWRVPVSIAAVVVLSVTLVTLIGEERGDMLLRDAPSPAAPPAAGTAEPAARPAGPPETRQRAPAAAPEAYSARRDEGVARAPSEARRAEQEASAGPGPAAGQGMRAAPASGADDRMLSRPPREAPRISASDQAKLEAPSIAAQPSTAEAAATGATSARPMAKGTQADQALAMKRLPVWHGLEQEPPQKWLERAAELKRQGRAGEAEDLLTEFKRRFHDQSIPPELE